MGGDGISLGNGVTLTYSLADVWTEQGVAVPCVMILVLSGPLLYIGRLVRKHAPTNMVDKSTQDYLLKCHGEDESEPTQDEIIDYQMKAKFYTNNVFWNRESRMEDFWFWVANSHPLYSLFCKHDKNPISWPIRLLIEFTTCLSAFQSAVSSGMTATTEINLPSEDPCCVVVKSPQAPKSAVALFTYYVAMTIMPILGSMMFYEQVACPCMPGTAHGKMGCCMRFCKCCGSCYAFYLIVLNLLLVCLLKTVQGITIAVVLHFVAFRCLGYLQSIAKAYFLQTFPVTKLPRIGKWTKGKASWDKMSLKETQDGLAPLLPHQRGETLCQGICKVMTVSFIVLAFFGLWMVVIVPYLMPQEICTSCDGTSCQRYVPFQGMDEKKVREACGLSGDDDMSQ